MLLVGLLTLALPSYGALILVGVSLAVLAILDQLGSQASARSR
jgi:hypothetical protein